MVIVARAQLYWAAERRARCGAVPTGCAEGDCVASIQATGALSAAAKYMPLSWQTTAADKVLWTPCDKRLRALLLCLPGPIFQIDSRPMAQSNLDCAPASIQ